MVVSEKKNLWQPCIIMPYPSQDDTWAWERLIVVKSEMAEQFAGRGQLDGFAWARILSRRPEFADRCDWSKLKPLAWLQLLMRRPQFTDKCDKWDGMRPFGGDRIRKVCGRLVKPM